MSICFQENMMGISSSTTKSLPILHLFFIERLRTVRAEQQAIYFVGIIAVDQSTNEFMLSSLQTEVCDSTSKIDQE